MKTDGTLPPQGDWRTILSPHLLRAYSGLFTPGVFHPGVPTRPPAPVPISRDKVAGAVFL